MTIGKNLFTTIYSSLVQREKDEEELATLEKKIAERQEVNFTSDCFPNLFRCVSNRTPSEHERTRNVVNVSSAKKRPKLGLWNILFYDPKFVYLGK
jgi:hypothetical protein